MPTYITINIEWADGTVERFPNTTERESRLHKLILEGYTLNKDFYLTYSIVSEEEFYNM